MVNPVPKGRPVARSPETELRELLIDNPQLDQPLPLIGKEELRSELRRQPNSLIPPLANPFEKISTNKNPFPVVNLNQGSLASNFLDLPPELQKEARSKIPQEQRTEFECEVQFEMLARLYGGKEATLLRQANLSSEQLSQLIEINPNPYSISMAGVKFPSKEEVALISNLSPPDFSGLEKISNSSLAKFMMTISSEDEAKIPQVLQAKIAERFKDHPETIVEIQQGRFQFRELVRVQNIRDGSRLQEIGHYSNYSESLLPPSISNYSSGNLKLLHGWRERTNEADRVLDAISDQLHDSRAHSRVAAIIKSIPPGSDEATNFRQSELIAKHLTEASSALYRVPLPEFNTRAGAEQIRDGNLTIANLAENLDTAVGVMTGVRNGAVVIVAAGAATIAAPVIFTAAVGATGSTIVAAGATIIGSGLVGAGTGAVYGGGTSGAENTVQWTLGNKSFGQALADTGTQALQDTKSGGIAGIGGGTSGLALKATSILGTTRAAMLIRGVSAGSSGAFGSSVSGSAIEVYEASQEFTEKFKGQILSDEELGREYALFLKERGLDWASLTAKLDKDVSYGALMGGLGSQFQILRESPTVRQGSIPKQLLVDGTEISTAGAIGFMRAYFDTPEEQRTFKQLLPLAIGEGFSNLGTTVQSRSGSRIGDKFFGAPVPKQIQSQIDRGWNSPAKSPQSIANEDKSNQQIADGALTNEAPPRYESGAIANDSEVGSLRVLENSKSGTVPVPSKQQHEKNPAHAKVRQILDTVIEEVNRGVLSLETMEASLSTISNKADYKLPNPIRDRVTSGEFQVADLITVLDRGAAKGDFRIADVQHVAQRLTGNELSTRQLSHLKVENYKRLYEETNSGRITANDLENSLRDLGNNPEYNLPSDIRNLLDSGQSLKSEQSVEQITTRFADKRMTALKQNLSDEIATMQMNKELAEIKLQTNRVPDLIAEAKKHSDAVTSHLQQALHKLPESAGAQLEGLKYRVKSEESLTRKIVTELTTEPELGILPPKALDATLNDTLRFTVLLETDAYSSGYQSVINDMQQLGYAVVKSKPVWPLEKARYVGINATLQDSSGQQFEVQFHTPESNFGNKVTHPFYERSRTLAPTDPEREALNQISYDITRTIPKPPGFDQLPVIRRAP